MIYYACANNINIGDYFSMLGVKDAVKLDGSELFFEKSNPPFSEKIKLLKEDDHLIIGGGGILKDNFEKYWLEILKNQKEKKYKIYIFGIGVCDHKNVSKSTVLNSNILNQIFSSSEINFLRPPINFDNKNIIETFCPSILHVNKKYYSKKITSKEQLLYVSHESLVGKDNNLKIINILKEYCTKNKLEYTEVNNISKTQKETDIIIEKYLNSKFIVTTRLHGYIIGTALRKNVVSISKDYKIDGFAKSIGAILPMELQDFNYDVLSKNISLSSPINENTYNKIINNIEYNGNIILNKIRK